MQKYREELRREREASKTKAAQEATHEELMARLDQLAEEEDKTHELQDLGWVHTVDLGTTGEFNHESERGDRFPRVFEDDVTTPIG